MQLTLSAQLLVSDNDKGLPSTSLPETPRTAWIQKVRNLFTKNKLASKIDGTRTSLGEKQRSGVDNFIKRTVIETNRDCETLEQEEFWL